MNGLEVDVQPVGAPVDRRRTLWRRILALVAALVVVAGVLLAAGVVSFRGGPATQLNRIVVVDAAGGLATVAADGSGRRDYPVAGASFQFPAWSPDGTHLAAIGGDGPRAAVYVFDDRAGAVRPRPPIVVYPTSTSYPIYVSWSPDGQRIAILTSENDGLALRIVSADGSSSTGIVYRGQPLYWDWVDDAHLLVHSGVPGPQAFVGEIALDATTSHVVSGTPGLFQAPGVSADGADVAYVATSSDAQAAVVVEGRTGRTRVQTPVQGASALGWSPQGDQLAYTVPATDNGAPFGALHLLDPGAGSTRTLLDGVVVAYFWAPDGRTIAAIRIVPAGGPTAALTPMTAATATELELTLVDVATGKPVLASSIHLPDLILSQFLPFFDQYAHSHRVWAPAGDALVLPLVNNAGSSEITVIPLDGSAPRVIADGVAAFWSPR